RSAGPLLRPFDVLERLLLVHGPAVVGGDGQAPVLALPVDRRRAPVELAAPAIGLGCELEPVGSDVAHTVDPDEPPRVLSGAAADAGDEGVAADEPLDLLPRLLGHARLLRAAHDRGERAVDVEHDRSALGSFGETVEGRHGSYDPAVRVVAIGL